MAIDEASMKTRRNLEFVRPEEGYVTWTDTLVVPTAEQNRYGAHLWINYLMDPKVSGQNASWVWYLSPIMPASWEYTKSFALLLKPSDEELARGEVINDLGEFATNYSDAWRQVKSA